MERRDAVSFQDGSWAVVVDSAAWGAACGDVWHPHMPLNNSEPHVKAANGKMLGGLIVAAEMNGLERTTTGGFE
jgi:hypothetical protein